MGSYTDLITQTRHDARAQLFEDAHRRGAQGVVVQEKIMDLQVYWDGIDDIAEATIVGTAIARFGPAWRQQPEPLAVVSLDPQRRQAARIRLDL